MEKFLVTGALGQIGTELVVRLREMYGEENVLPTDIRMPERGPMVGKSFEILDVTDKERVMEVVEAFQPDSILHLAALLSATAEENPELAWHINMGGLFNTIEAARIYGTQYFTPSSIGSFGPSTPKDNTPQHTLMRPTTMYGVNKVAGELLLDYYYTKFGLDTRSVRFPGLISFMQEPGGGTTDYAVEIYFDAIRKGEYTSFIDKGTYMDMMFMDDAIDAIIDLLHADPEKLKTRNAFNVSAMSIEPEMVAESIRKHIPDFKLNYDVDPVRQGIAESWPNSLDCSEAKEQWDFNPKYDLDKMTEVMLKNIKVKVTEQ
ncbi:NAD-dependent epimerase/dehydratase family protein [Nosocomiicoccus massiliensis]|uniref:NAD-dependent epimerase/dehydratase family protein n=1 Tax=Nosocomiicoccus massiliensis TaxID=1232430 RepID=A0AAF0YLU7_9STAP|nr:NAD-dependent epimerase/dehydratase family protein [Nosocomiicoccus massiliensis]WOS95522.1 NAD-dependent epimerase/dehydratase family protein [Nosocomiicoccus massiliensis]